MSKTTGTQADREEICRAVREHRRPDPEVAKRVHERAEKLRQEVFQKHGLLDIGIDIIREMRDSLCESSSRHEGSLTNPPTDR
jgi:hypothetical protein